MCLGFINGVAQMWLINRAICYNHVTDGEIADVVVKYMNDHPDEVRRHTAMVLIGIALKAAYPVTQECIEQTK
jgi:Rap1a immunity proteins